VLGIVVVLVAAGLGVFAVVQRSAASPTTQEYAASDAAIANPERGWYRGTETHANADGGGYTPLDANQLKGWRAEGTTLVFRYFYLERFRTTPAIDAAYLAAMERDFAIARAAGVKLIVRFAYVKGGSGPYQPPYQDATKDVVLSHIAQLGPVLTRNADVVAVLQAGFIGLWGEWFYTDHFAHDPANPGDLEAADWQARGEVLTALQKAVPATMLLQVRYPQILQRLDADARVGVHDDCFLADDTDSGTYKSTPPTTDQDWLAQHSASMVVGGETCKVNPPRSQFPTAAAELARYHWTFLNRDFDTSVLGTWGTDGTAQVSRSLGYRLALAATAISPTARPSGAIDVRLSIDNSGWSAPVSERPVQLVLRGPGGTFQVPLDTDVRSWQPGRTEVEGSVCAPATPGEYALLLALPDPSPSLAGNPAYAIQLANQGAWEPATGLNDLKRTVTVDGATPWLGCTAPQPG
jgi:hypothetical protein